MKSVFGLFLSLLFVSTSAFAENYCDGSKKSDSWGTYYPNGRNVKDSWGAYYHNGQKISDSWGSYHINGAKISDSWGTYYPNGQKVSDSWGVYYPNGRKVKDSWGCYDEDGQKRECESTIRTRISLTDGVSAGFIVDTETGAILQIRMTARASRKMTFYYHIDISSWEVTSIEAHCRD